MHGVFAELNQSCSNTVVSPMLTRVDLGVDFVPLVMPKVFLARNNQLSELSLFANRQHI